MRFSVLSGEHSLNRQRDSLDNSASHKPLPVFQKCAHFARQQLLYESIFCSKKTTLYLDFFGYFTCSKCVNCLNTPQNDRYGLQFEIALSVSNRNALSRSGSYFHSFVVEYRLSSEVKLAVVRFTLLARRKFTQFQWPAEGYALLFLFYIRLAIRIFIFFATSRGFFSPFDSTCQFADPASRL